MKPLKILHTADWHIGELTGPVVAGQNAREQDTLNCIDYLIDQADKEEVDLILVAGDLFDRSKLWGDTMLREIEYAADRLRRLASVAPTVLLFGTANHDSMQAFMNLAAMQIPNLYIVTGPYVVKVMVIVDKFANKSIPVQVACIPGFDKGYFRAKNPGMSPEEENQVCSKMLGDIVLGLNSQINPEYPAILMAHYTVVDCQLDNGEHVFLQSDIVLPKDALLASTFDLVCLGHIHRAQSVEHCGKPVFYSGPPNGLTFNEEGQVKGFWLYGLDSGKELSHYQFIKTPSRRFYTLNWDEQDVDLFLNGYPFSDVMVKDAIVRLHYSCSSEMEKHLNRKALEKALYDAGAFYVSEIRPVKLIEELQKEALQETAGPLENLIDWLKTAGHGEGEIGKLIEMAKPLIATVSAKMPTGKLSGVFRPKRLEVKNYRSYREESFSFDPVTFAIVNGPNGVGKSAFFGDAVSDCLFEETREGDLTGWISNLPEVKSGAITFEFAMGDTDWRVTRTRLKSGKTTLALAEQVNGEWQDRSADKTRDTQEKIITLLGMDAMTFRSCALIMQDAYGLFLEADKEDRMQVLGNLLGLNIYDQLTDLAKAKVTELNRLLDKDKSKLAELAEKVKDRPELETELQVLETELLSVADQILSKEQQQAVLNQVITALQAKVERIAEMQKQVTDLSQQNTAKFTEKTAHQQKLGQAQARLQQEPEIIAKVAEHDQVKEKIVVLKAKRPRLQELVTAGNQCKADMQKFDNQLTKLDGQINDVRILLSNKAGLEAAVIRYRTVLEQLIGLDSSETKFNGLQFKMRDAQALLTKAQHAYETKKQSLETERETLASKVEMLGDSNCINPDEANCRFLANAQQAKKRLAVVEAEQAALQPTEVSLLQSTVDAIQQQIDQLHYDPVNHKQLKELVVELRPKAEQAASLASKAELLVTLEGQHKQLTDQRATAYTNFQKYGAEFQILNKELQMLTGLEQDLANLERWVVAKEKLPASREIVKATTEAIAGIDAETMSRQQQISKIEIDIFALNQEVADIYQHQLSANALATEMKELLSKQNRLHSQIGGLKSRLDTLTQAEAERARIARSIEPLAEDLTHYLNLAAAFNLDGIPFAIVRSVVPELSLMANDILGQMTGGKMTLEMRTERIQKSNKREVNALEIWITDYIRGSLPYKSRSGGQKVKAALSVAFALADLKARRAGIQLGMMFVDEPPFLDADGTDAYCDALELLGKRYQNMMVIAISHDPAMKARFPQEIQVEDRGEEGSKVRLIA
ncbi:exonuclease subunit SbcD [Anaerospora hongkongensis]|uniref:exonuclease subunit SbcD n=1 Tax=Anaerospora hongkongensis TaxID=244830 RepID=UPI00289D8D45|nr:exonuclease subunit SbcD [Anaerospora hongkongensis]